MTHLDNIGYAMLAVDLLVGALLLISFRIRGCL